MADDTSAGAGADWRSVPRPHEVVGPIPVLPTLPSVLRRAVENWGDLLCMIDGDRRITFAEADRQSAELAKGFLAMGIGRGSRVAIQMPNNADWVLCYFALGRIGALPVAFSTLYQRREESWALRHNDIDTLLVSERFLSHDYQARLEEAVPELAGQSRDRPFYLKSHPYLRRVIVWGDNQRPWAMKGPDDVLARAAATPQVDDALLKEMESTITPADDLIIICTSGTTAEPKAVVETHGQGFRNTWNNMPNLGMRAGEPFYDGLAFFWIGGHLRGINPMLFTGACMVLPQKATGDEILDLVLRERITVIAPGGRDFHDINAAIARRKPDLSFVRKFLPHIHRDTGQPMPPEQRIGGSLGMTETFGTHSTEALDWPVPPGKATTWGRPQPDVERRIVHLETGEVLGPGEVGELQLRGPTIMRGYLKRERHECFTPDGFFRTGDRCMIDEDDFLFFYGRANDMIKTAGANVAPAEVEAVLVANPEVREAIVFGISDRERGQAVAAVVVPAEGCAIEPAVLKARARAEISSYKVPQVIVAMTYDEVPRTDAAGKPKRNVLREMVEKAREASPGYGQ